MVRQGTLESANVNLVRTMADMITALRTYESYQKAIQAADETMSKAINEVGRVV